jgi:hypothetical protein
MNEKLTSPAPSSTGSERLERPETPVDHSLQPPPVISVTHCDPVIEETLSCSALKEAERYVLKFRGKVNLADFGGPGDSIRTFNKHFAPHGAIAVQTETSGLSHVWIIGDIHADLVGLACSLAYIKETRKPGDPRSVVILLGDLIDDMDENVETLAMVSDFMTGGQDDFELLVIRGNHDVSLQRSPNGEFTSSVDPCEFCDQLKGSHDQTFSEDNARIAQSFITYMASAPAALFLRDGTLLAHGGAPHPDLHAKIVDLETLGGPDAASDFTWARLPANIKRRLALPQGASRSRELGAYDFNAFRELAARILGFPVERIVRGHEHVGDRFEVLLGPWEGRVITINNMSWRLSREFGPSSQTNPCIAEWRSGQPIVPHRLILNPEWRERLRNIQRQNSDQ